MIDRRIGGLNDPTSNVQASDSGARAVNAIPLLAARIAIEPVGVVSPLRAIGGRVKVHESLSCQRLVHQYRSEARELAALAPQPSHSRAACRAAYVALMVRSHTLPAPQRSKELPVPLLQRRAKEEERWVACVADARSWLANTHTHTLTERRGEEEREHEQASEQQPQQQQEELPHLSDSLNQPNQPHCSSILPAHCLPSLPLRTFPSNGSQESLGATGAQCAPCESRGPRWHAGGCRYREICLPAGLLAC